MDTLKELSWRLPIVDAGGTAVLVVEAAALTEPRAEALTRLAAFDQAHGTRYFDGLGLREIPGSAEAAGRLCRERGAPEEAVLTWLRSGPTSLVPEMRAGSLDLLRWLLLLSPQVVIELVGPRAEAVARCCQAGGLPPGRVRCRAPDAAESPFAVLTDRPDRLDVEQGVLVVELGEGEQRFDLTGLVGPGAMPPEVDLVWHGVNDVENLRQFLASEIRWGECDVRRCRSGRLITRHDSFEQTPRGPREALLGLDEVLARCGEAGRSLKLDLKQGDPETVAEVLALVATHRLEADRLWFNANLEVLGEEGFRRIAEAYPGAILQCPISGLWPLIVSTPETARGVLEEFASWGVNRVSLNWKIGQVRGVFRRLREWGYAVNLYAFDGLQDTLQGTALCPASITTDFNFPQWHYFGRGPGHRLRYHHYALRTAGE